MRLFILMVLTGFGGYVEAGQVESLIFRAAARENVPKELLLAICTAESSLSPGVVVFGDGGSDNPAIGVCQILYKTAQEAGFGADPTCLPAHFDVTLCGLSDPYRNARYAAKHLKSLLKRYDNSWVDAIAAYNAGSVRLCTSGKVTSSVTKKVLYHCAIGGILNQRYVDKVINILHMMGAK